MTRKEIGIELKLIRNSKGLSMDKVAEKCKLDRRQIIQIEKGTHNFGVDNMCEYMNALGVKLKINE